MATIFGRVMNAVRAGIVAFNQQAIIPVDPEKWDDWEYRLMRHNYLRMHYHNVAYDNIARFAAMYKHTQGLYEHTRGIYNPYARIVDLYPGVIYGGALDIQTLNKGAIPFVLENNRQRNALRQLLQWSNFATQKALFVRQGAMVGDVALKIVDDRALQQVRIEILDTCLIKHLEVDSIGRPTYVVIEYEMEEEKLFSPTSKSIDRKTFTYTEEITPKKFATYRNGEPYAFYSDANGNLVSEWANEYDRVPMRIVKHRDIGSVWGAPAVTNSALRKIDEINDAASNFNDSFRKTIRPIWYFAGVQAEDELDVSTRTTNTQSGVIEGKDKLQAIYGPEGSQPFPMVANIDASAAIANIQNMLLELEREAPETSLNRIRESGELTAPGVRSAYADAINKIMESRANYDDGLVEIAKMGIEIGGYNRYRNFEGFGLDSVERGDLDIYVADRQVIEDELPKETRINFLIQTGAPRWKVWKEMDISDDEIARMESDVENEQMVIEQRINDQVNRLARDNQPQLQSGVAA